jgi:GH15 family glucan-1,4-alpha-glucosidase
MVVPMADFLSTFIDKTTGLPKPSYDLWEQTHLTSTYTTALVYAALLAASDLAVVAEDNNNAIKWRTVANEIQIAAGKYLYNEKKKVFYRGLNVKDGKIILDDVIDNSSVFGSYIFGLFDINSTEMKNSMETIKQVFGINDGEVGLPRYENDDYRRASEGITGNKWFITSLWLAQYYIDQSDTKNAMIILDWVKDKALGTGIMAEQYDPVADKIVSPAPLTWTHSEYVSTLLDMIAKSRKL